MERIFIKSCPSFIRNNQISLTHRPNMECEVCYKQFNTASSLKSHRKVHNAENVYACDLCHKTFRSRSYVDVHRRIHTGEKPYACDLCDKRFSDHANLTCHKRTHTGEKRFECYLCDKKFAYRASLAAHMKMHQGIKDFACDLCGKEFSRRAHLSLHRLTHTPNLKPFACELCSKRFVTQVQLKKHMTKHSQEKVMLKCTFCDEEFSRQKSLDLHLAKFGGKKMRKCDTCDKKFCNINSRWRHKKTHPKVIPDFLLKLNNTYPITELVESETSCGELRFRRRSYVGPKPFSSISTVQVRRQVARVGKKSDLGATSNQIDHHYIMPNASQANQSRIKTRQVPYSGQKPLSARLVEKKPEQKEAIKPKERQQVKLSSKKSTKPPFGLTFHNSACSIVCRRTYAGLKPISSTCFEISEQDASETQLSEHSETETGEVCVKATDPNYRPNCKVQNTALCKQKSWFDTCKSQFTQEFTGQKQVATPSTREKKEKTHECDLCLKKFYSKSHVEVHRRIHTGERPFVCDLCDRRFTDKSSLTYHKRTHTGIKPYQCNLCEKKFSLRSTLKMHLKLHLGVKDFACDLCNKKFARFGHLASHKTVVHKVEAPYACELCDKKYFNLDTLQVHRQKHTELY